MPKAKSTEVYVRKNISFPAGFEDQLEVLRKEYGLASHSELIRFAVNNLEKAGIAAYREKRARQKRQQSYPVAAE